MKFELVKKALKPKFFYLNKKKKAEILMEKFHNYLEMFVFHKKEKQKIKRKSSKSIQKPPQKKKHKLMVIV